MEVIYNRRRLVGKTIGSGRMEKGVDLTLAVVKKAWVGDLVVVEL